MDYKASKYNIICRTGTKVLLFNTLSGSFVEFNEKLRNELNICLSKLEGNKEIVEYLKSNASTPARDSCPATSSSSFISSCRTMVLTVT